MRIAVVLFNLGGPDGPDSVEPFLFNLFYDPAIIRLPGPLRWLVAKLISRRRAPVAREVYAHIGGGSPLLANTEIQAAALTAACADLGEVKCFTVMRYWHPRADAVAGEVKAFAPDRIVLLPLYPQFSTTTTASSLQEWAGACRDVGLAAPSCGTCCYPTEEGFVTAAAEAISTGLAEAEQAGIPRLLFSAHGLPKKVVAAGDPYQWQVEQTAAAIAAKLGDDGLDWRVCYQSRVGPMEWIRPYLADELQDAGAEGRPVVIFPLAFVSEHSETLVELDIEYREKAAEWGVPAYVRIGTVDAAPAFIAGLARTVRHAMTGEGLRCGAGETSCPETFGGCALRNI